MSEASAEMGAVGYRDMPGLTDDERRLVAEARARRWAGRQDGFEPDEDGR